MSGFSTTFSHYLMEVSSEGGSERPESDEEAEGVLFVVEGTLELVIEGERHVLAPAATCGELHSSRVASPDVV